MAKNPNTYDSKMTVDIFILNVWISTRFIVVFIAYFFIPVNNIPFNVLCGPLLVTFN
jgi:hypothetical protein